MESFSNRNSWLGDSEIFFKKKTKKKQTTEKKESKHNLENKLESYERQQDTEKEEQKLYYAEGKRNKNFEQIAIMIVMAIRVFSGLNHIDNLKKN